MTLTYRITVGRITLALLAAVICGGIIGGLVEGRYPPLNWLIAYLFILVGVIEIAIEPRIDWVRRAPSAPPIGVNMDETKAKAPSARAYGSTWYGTGYLPIQHIYIVSQDGKPITFPDSLSSTIPKGQPLNMDAKSFALAVEDVVKQDATVLESALSSLGVKVEALYAEAAPVFQEEVKTLEGEVGPLLAEIAKSKPVETLTSFVKLVGADAESAVFAWWLKAKLQSLGAAPIVAPAATTDDAAAAIAGALAK